MTRVLRLLALALIPVAALAACDIDFTEVNVPPPGGSGVEPHQPAVLRVDLGLEDQSLPGLRLAGRLSPGATADGSIRRVSNDTLYLGERALAPVQTDEWGQRSYWWTASPESERGTLSITAPLVEGLDALPPVVLRGYSRTGPDTVPAAPGDTLRFEIAPDPEGADAPSTTSWSFTLNSPGLGLHRSDTTAVPTLVVVPTDWIGWAGTDPVDVRLSAREVWVRELPDGRYTATITVSWQLRWTVVWPGAAKSHPRAPVP